MKVPRYRRIAAGQVWRVQRVDRGPFVHPVLTAEVDEVTPETVMLRWLADGAIEIRANALALRYRRAEFAFVERVRP